MKDIIIRKPKFMRNDKYMDYYMEVAMKLYRHLQINNGLTFDEQMRELIFIADTINKSAKYGGFFRLKDFMKWMNKHKTIT